MCEVGQTKHQQHQKKPTPIDKNKQKIGIAVKQIGTRVRKQSAKVLSTIQI